MTMSPCDFNRGPNQDIDGSTLLEDDLLVVNTPNSITVGGYHMGRNHHSFDPSSKEFATISPYNDAYGSLK